MIKISMSLGLCLITVFALAQTGTVRGTITDANTGEAIPFVNVLVDGTGGGFTTDLDGAYAYNLPKGTYTFKVSYVGYSNYKVENVVVKAGEVTITNIGIQQDKQLMEEVVVTARQLQDTQNAMLTVQRKSLNVINGISAQSFRQTGDSDAGSAIKRVTGVSVNEGKYVFVRGLGDRYTKTMLNGMPVPGLDPDRNALQIDIFPTNILDNIIISKTFKADLPGDFTGGVVDISTKDFPEEKTIGVSVGIGYNPDMHFNNNFPVAESGKTDWLGFDDGTRDLNVGKHQRFPAPIDDPRLTALTARFKNNMAVQRSGKFANYNIGLSMGNQVNKNRITLGYNAAVNYRRNTIFYPEVLFNSYIKPTDNTKTEILINNESKGQMGIDKAQLSGMISGALKLKKHKFGILLLHLQNGESTAGVFERNTYIRASNNIVSSNVEYTERSITNVLLKGDHYLSRTLDVMWKFSSTYSTIRDKDVRITPFKYEDEDDNTFTIEPSEGAQPRRLWRNLDESNYSARVDLKKSFSIFDRNLNVKAGLSNTYKARNYEILSYLINMKGQSHFNLSGDPNELLLPENIWTPEKQIGTYVIGNFEPANTYSAYQNIIGAYVMTDIELLANFKANVGVRMEKFLQGYTGQSNTGLEIYDNEKIADNTDFLPAVNLVYQIGKLMNLRASYSKTLARPSFKEASIAQIYDALSDRTFLGNIDLKQTHINNYDVRWEMFSDNGQLLSVSGFYKTFTNPIELVAFSSSAPGNLQPRNVGKANVIGTEVEFKRNLGFISPRMKSLYIGSNFTLVKSSVQLDKSANGEYESRQTSRRKGEFIAETRQMQGQAPYMINAYINYLDNGWEVNFSYNVQGSTLSVVGIGLNSDVYTAPYHDLSCRVAKQLGKNKRFKISIGIKNILDASKAKYYHSYGSTKQPFEHYMPRRTFNLAFNWQL